MQENKRSFHYIVFIVVITINILVMMFAAVFWSMREEWLRFGLFLFACLLQINGIAILEVYFRLKRRLIILENTIKNIHESGE